MDWDGRTNTYISVNPVIFSDATVLYIIICYLEACFCCLTVVPTWIFLRALSHSFWPGAAVIQVFSRLFMLSVTALDKKKTLYISASQKCKKYYNIRPAFMLLIMFKRSDLLIISIIIYMKKCRNSDWLRAVRLIPKQWNFVLSVQIYVIKFWREKILHGKNKYGGQHLANSGNISLRFEVNSTVTLPVKCPLTKLEES